MRRVKEYNSRTLVTAYHLQFPELVYDEPGHLSMLQRHAALLGKDGRLPYLRPAAMLPMRELTSQRPKSPSSGLLVSRFLHHPYQQRTSKAQDPPGGKCWGEPSPRRPVGIAHFFSMPAWGLKRHGSELLQERHCAPSMKLSFLPTSSHGRL